jgi:hypothetical protein
MSHFGLKEVAPLATGDSKVSLGTAKEISSPTGTTWCPASAGSDMSNTDSPSENTSAPYSRFR